MARKSTVVEIAADGRDKGKRFLLTEMSATQAEKFAAKVLFAAGQSGAQIPDDVVAAGFAGLASIGLRAFAGIPFHIAEGLMDEMMACVQMMPDPAHPQVTRPLIEDDIEEIGTRVKLREELVTLHTGFSIAAYLSTLLPSGQAAGTGTTPTTSTSPAPSQ